MSPIKQTIQSYITTLKDTLDSLPHDRIEQVIDLLHQARINGRQIFILGNGGSASTASHFACDLGKNVVVPGQPRIRVMALTDNMATFSAYANDNGYDSVFAEQLENLANPEDIVIGISTSGNSPNVINAMRYANSIEALTIGFTGFEGGLLRETIDVDLHVPSNCIEQVEDIHVMLEHLIVTALRKKMDIYLQENQEFAEK